MYKSCATPTGGKMLYAQGHVAIADLPAAGKIILCSMVISISAGAWASVPLL
jgi:hypothetical protein